MNSPTAQGVAPALPTPQWRAWRWRPYALAVVMTLAMVALYAAVSPWVGERPVMVLFVLPVLVSAYVGGLGPGLLSTVLMGLGTCYFVVPPTFTFAFAQPVDFAQWLVTLFVGVLLSVHSAELHHWRRSANGAAHGSRLSRAELKVQLGFAMALVCLGVVGVASYLSVARLSDSAASVEHAHRVVGRLDGLFALSTDAHNALRGYTIAGDESYLEPYHRANNTMAAELRTLRDLLADNPAQQRRADELAQKVQEQLEGAARTVLARRSEGFDAIMAVVASGAGKRTHDAIRALVDQMKHDEESRLRQRSEEARRRSVTTQFIIAGGSVLGFGVVALALLALGRDFEARQRAERALREAKDDLEWRVAQRTVELARANESLSHSERRFRALVEHGSDGIMLSRQDGTIIYASPAIAAITGYTPDEMVGRTVAEFRHSDEHEARRRGLRELLDHPEQPRRVVWRHRHKTDDWRWLEGVVRNLLHDPAVGAIVTNYRDVTDRIMAEARMRAQMQRLTLLGQVTRAIGERQDLNSIFQVVIRTLEEQLPADLACVCLHEPGSDVLTVTRVGLHSASLAMDLALGEHASIEVSRNGLASCLNGRLVYEPDLTASAYPFLQRLSRGGLGSMVVAPLPVQGQVFGILLMARRRAEAFSSGECEFLSQVSEHVALAAHQAQLHGALQAAYDDLRQTQQAVMQQERLRVIGQMASGIAHDINNAISPVALYAESLLEREPNLSDRARERLKHIESAVSDVAATVGRLREFYRPREPDAPLGEVQLNALAQQVIEITRARWRDMPLQRGVVIEALTDLEPDLPAVTAIEGEIREALVNLVFNAADAMPEGGTLTVRTRRVADSEHVRVQVVDTGVGMDEQTRRRCLEPFFTTKGERGTGLGLGMVYGTMQRHGGDLEIDSQPGVGTTVTLLFKEAPREAGWHVPPEAAGPGRGMTLLVVDDDPLLLRSMRDTLEGDGHIVHTANGGQAGIETFASLRASGQQVDVVITDLGMPHVDGRQVARAVKQCMPRQPVILLTGWGQRLVAEGEAPEHVDEVLSKPPRLGELRAALARHVPQV